MLSIIVLKAYFISIGESMNRRKGLIGVAPKAPTSRVGGGLSTRDTLHLSASASIRVNSTEGILTFWLIRLRGTHLIRSCPFAIARNDCISSHPFIASPSNHKYYATYSRNPFDV